MTKRKYTKQEREDAADACALMASSDEDGQPGLRITWFGWFGACYGAAGDLAREAFWVPSFWFSSRERWAEAEAMIRTGWSPP